MSVERLTRTLLAKGCSTDEVADILENLDLPIRQESKTTSKKDGRLAHLGQHCRDTYESLKSLGGKGDISGVYANCENGLCRNSIARYLNRLVHVYDLVKVEYTGGRNVYTLL